MEISVSCAKCGARLEGAPPNADHCGEPLFPYATERFLKEGKLNQCPHCGAAHLYRQKDFNRRLGIALVVVGVLLAWWTYGISLLLVTVIDWWLYRRVGDVGCCYQCTTQFRGPPVASLEPFNLELHDYYRSKQG
jgi:hypothetical protein